MPRGTPVRSTQGAMELFSYHLIRAPVHQVAARLMNSRALRAVPGLRHAECLIPMRMGHPVLRPSRYHFTTLALFAFWNDEVSLERFLEAPPYPVFARAGWHVRMRFYRRWGTYTGLDEATVYRDLGGSHGPVIGVTFARLKLSETFRFQRWGRPVEAQVRDHPGVIRAAVAYRPLNTFSTFSVWQSEEEMLGMVHGHRTEVDGTQHRRAMVERERRPFHHEFTTMRFLPLSEHGEWPLPKDECGAPGETVRLG
ncbi:MAG: hypothetical protein D6729_11750 [Deltaproteobacteria bacterium]|nr:MAG: hypothetical protein D6729_11750 [Deltaproteobacteria bacterium]